jgi:hypothetical protein
LGDWEPVIKYLPPDLRALPPALPVFPSRSCRWSAGEEDKPEAASTMPCIPRTTGTPAYTLSNSNSKLAEKSQRTSGTIANQTFGIEDGPSRNFTKNLESLAIIH